VPPMFAGLVARALRQVKVPGAIRAQDAVTPPGIRASIQRSEIMAEITQRAGKVAIVTGAAGTIGAPCQPSMSRAQQHRPGGHSGSRAGHSKRPPFSNEVGLNTVPLDRAGSSAHGKSVVYQLSESKCRAG
jgi:hypothetical protein